MFQMRFKRLYGNSLCKHWKKILFISWLPCVTCGFLKAELWHLLNLNPHPHPQNGSGEVLVNYDLHSVMIINVISAGSKPQLQVIPIRPEGRALITAVSIFVAPSCTLYMSGYEYII